MKLLSIIILQSWAMTLSADNCVYPKYAASEMKSVQVYQVTHIVNTTINEAAVKVDLMKHLITLPSGNVCLRKLGTCYDSRDHSRYSWEVSKDRPEEDLTCRDLMRLHADENYLRYTYHILVLKRNPFVQFLVAESPVSMFSLQLIKEKTFCNKTVWSTDQSELLVAVGEENFIDTSYEFADPFPEKFITGKKEEIYTSMMIKCELYSHIMEYEEQANSSRIEEAGSLQDLVSSYEEQIGQLRENLRSFESDLFLKNREFKNLRDEVNEIKATMQDMQKEINGYKDENVYLKKSLKDVRSKLLTKLDSAKLKENLSEDTDEAEVFGKKNNIIRKENMFGVPQFVIEALSNSEDCPNFIFFPYDYLLCVLASGLYVIFAVINTITNYFSLRLLRNSKQKCFVFYTLTQGLTTRYICRNQILTKNKVDKWLLDLE